MNNTIIVTVAIVVLAAFVPLGQLAEATSIGTLTAFAIVNFGVLALWLKRPDLALFGAADSAVSDPRIDLLHLSCDLVEFRHMGGVFRLDGGGGDGYPPRRAALDGSQ